MDIIIPEEGEPSKEGLEKAVDESEIELVKKASRAFAVSYMNEIYKTVKSLDPKVVEKIKLTRHYPYYLYLFIHQDRCGKIKELDIYSRQKLSDDGLCEVKEIYHDCECGNFLIEKKKKRLGEESLDWRWSKL
ncbi:MAG: hypothetical protein JSV09_10895 [Thermoplasmata archaeon]|nr:MAG: hypothetical protein JSV09_10895 [Thermoplasmata archaeon]